jgi:transcriptional regulator with XRE-family HTH domain/Zn-dependent peptidase ImmA (M78 family)
MKSNNQTLFRKAHFLGAKIKKLRKDNGLTLDDLSVRCIHVDAQSAPSVSYLSMIENGKRIPSEDMLEVIASVFQKDIGWFFDETTPQQPLTAPRKASGGVAGVVLEPGFLFSKDHLQIAIPELLSQGGITGRQFGHLLIRAHQEHHHNRFPDLEKAAEDVGKKAMPLSVSDTMALCKKLGLKIKWFDRAPDIIKDPNNTGFKTLIRSFFEPGGTIYCNERLKNSPARLKYDIATHIGHSVLHNSDGLRSISAVGGNTFDAKSWSTQAQTVDSKDILHAWRDFECSFFAGALLCPKIPARQFLGRHAYSLASAKLLDVSTAVLMRRMTAVSPYPHWHYFDAYPPGKLRAVYRGNGIPLPWGNLREMNDPCTHWSVFNMLNAKTNKPASQISVLRNGDDARLYCCESIRVKDAADNFHVVCAGIDIGPAIDAQGASSEDVIDEIFQACLRNKGSAQVPARAAKIISSVANILSIDWVKSGLDHDANIICPRSSNCPRDPCCVTKPAKSRLITEDIRDAIVREVG